MGNSRPDSRPPCPDPLIRALAEGSLAVYVETKTFDWFYNAQLEAHLKALVEESPGLNLLLALGNFESQSTQRFARIESLCQKKYKGKVAFAAASFEDLVNALQTLSLSKNLSDAVADFREFLDEEDLLPSWHDLLDVVNCAGIPEDVLVGQVYMCPATGGAYSHARCKYFGMYRNKRVERVAIIEAVVDVDPDADATVKWSNVDRNPDELREVAREKVETLRPEAGPTRVFILGPQFETDFRKDSPGGMQSSKRYFDVSSLQVQNAEQLAEQLDGKVWSTFE